MSDTQDARSRQWRGQVLYPIVYRVSAADTAFFLFLAVLSGGLCFCFFYLLGIVRSVGYPYIGGLALVTLMLAVYCVAFAFRAGVTLEADGIVVRGAFRARSMAYANIVGRRMMWSRRQSCPVIVPATGKALKLTPSVYGLDDRFDRWFLPLPNLDAVDVLEQMNAWAAVEKEASQGIPRATWRARLESARQWSRRLDALTIALLVWAVIYPHPYDVVMASIMALPWVAALLLWRRPGLFQLDGGMGDLRPNVLVPVMLPAMLLAGRFMADRFMIDMRQLCLWGIVAGLPLFLVLVRAPRMGQRKTRARRAVIVFLVPFVVAYGVGVLGLVNAAMDRKSPQVFHSTIVGKYSSPGRHRSYELYLSRWHPIIGMARFSVSRSYYESVQENDRICVRLHRGAMEFRWLELAACD